MHSLVVTSPPKLFVKSVPKRLKALVEQGLGCRLTIITGPAGYGKTPLLSWCANNLCEQGFCVYWVVCEDEDEDENENENQKSFISFKELFASISQNFNRGLTKEVYIFFDDIDFYNNPHILSSIQEALTAAPDFVHFIYASVSSEGLGLSCLRYNAAIQEITKDDLALTWEEFENSAREASQQQLPFSKLKELYGIVLGWPIGVKACCSCFEKGLSVDEVLQRANSVNSWINDLIYDEIFPCLSKDSINFTYLMSTFDCFSADMAHSVLQIENCESIIYELSLNGVIITTSFKGNSEISDCSEWYCFHPLLYPVIQAKARQYIPLSEFQSISSKAIAYFETHKFVNMALDFAYDHEDYNAAFGVIARNLFPLLVSYDATKIRHIVENAQCESDGEGACCCLIAAWSLFLEGSTKRASIWLSRFEKLRNKGAVPSNYKGTDLVYKTIKVGINVFEGNYDKALEEGSASLETLGGPQLFLRATIMHNMGEALERTGQYDKALEYFFRSRTIADISGRKIVSALCDYEVAWLYFIQEKLDAASNVVLRSISENAKLDKKDSWAFGALHVSMARLYLQWGNLDHVHECLDKASTRLSPTQNRDAYLECKVTLARCLSQEGRTDEANEVLAGLYEMVSFDSTPRGVDLLVLVSYADNLVDMNKVEYANSILDEVAKRIDSRDAFYCIHSNLVKSRIMILTGDNESAYRLLCSSLERAKSAGVYLLATDCKVRLACVLRLLGENEKSKEFMSEALADSMQESRTYLFRNAVPCQNSIIYEIAYPTNDNCIIKNENQSACSYARKILKLFASSKEPKDDNKNLSPQEIRTDLSAREKEVYALLKQGKTRREISEELGIKINTVRTHVKNIYRKTGIHNRAQL